MGGQLSCFSSRDYNPKITQKIIKQRNIAALYNDIFEKEDHLDSLWLKILTLVRRRQEKAIISFRLEELARKTFEKTSNKILERRKKLLLDVIATGIQVQDLECQLAAIVHRYSTLWSLAYEDDIEDQLADWKRDMRRTRSHNDTDKVIPRPPLNHMCYLSEIEGKMNTLRDSSNLDGILAAEEELIVDTDKTENLEGWDRGGKLEVLDWRHISIN
ncbi:uncharacterized protein LOC114575199 [Exaiptasia diaphana]|uniref:Uncharacterized protein n=1 Tax=Exaiptasia diaphana TaxID=2652724 RepID=A0A913YJ22_EXADI|nr:uncharacterized protein LOC114575199 [Exaiptasia diaphana]